MPSQTIETTRFFSFLPLPNGYFSDKIIYVVIFWRRIEVVITGRTRNALALRGTWVQIPPSPRINKAGNLRKQTIGFCILEKCDYWYLIFSEKCAKKLFIFQKNVLCYYYSRKGRCIYEAKCNAIPDKLEKRPGTKASDFARCQTGG